MGRHQQHQGGGGRGGGRRGFAPPPPHHAAYAPPPAPPGGPPTQSYHQPPPPFHHAPPPPPLPAALERDVAAFVSALRASRSDAAAPPNALNVRDAIHAICAQFGAAAYEALCGPHHQPPAPLRALQTQHERVWSFVTCYQHARRVHTLFECHQAFLQHEGLRHFGELGIGNSFVHTDAVQALYRAPAAIYRLTTKDVLTAFRQFESVMGHDAFAPTARGGHHHGGGPPQRIDREQFKQFLAQQRRQPSAEAMGLYIDPDGFGPYIAMLRRIAKKEQKEIHELQDEFNKGIADRVFELSKEKFSAENRQQALAELLQRTNDERATELARGEPSAASKRPAAGGNKATSTLSSLSLDILNRVTDVDVYLDNMLRRKSADERYKSRLASHTIADTDQKIRTQLTPFLLASQKSRHHARVKVVTWVLCGVLAKIHTLLQLDDKIPEATASKDEETEEKNKSSGGAKGTDEHDDDEGEECDCCCVGEDTCRCRCQCECHQDESEDEGKPSVQDKQPEGADKTDEASNEAHSSPAKRKRSRSRSDSVAVSLDEVKSALEHFLSEHLGAVEEATTSTESAVKLLASAESHLRTKFAGQVGSFSVLSEVAKELEVVAGAEPADRSGLGQVAECIRRGRAPEGNCVVSLSSVSKDELSEFVAECFQALPNESRDGVGSAIVYQACVQFGLDRTDQATRRWLEGVIADAIKNDSSDNVERSNVHYARALALQCSLRGEGNEQALMTELALLDDEASRDQVIATKTAEAQTVLAQCPFLLDVGEWCRWRVRFEPFCGSLRAFLRSHEMIRLHDDHASSPYEFVCCTNDRVMKIRGGGDTSASALDTAEIAPEALALELVSLFVQHRGSTNDFPRELVLLHMRSILKRTESADSNGDSGQDLLTARARFVLDTMLSAPHDFAAFVWGLLHDATKATDLEEEVLAGCQSRVERHRLQLLGELLSKEKWLSCLDETPPPQPLREISPSLDVQIATTGVVAALDSGTTRTIPTRIEASLVEKQHPEVSPVLLDTDSCQAFIHKLRREQFGIGLEIADAGTRAVLQAQHRRLERALKRLSDELYSEKTHFVLELLQNADDNKYPAGTLPRGEFVLTKDGTIVFANNEIGFSERNIQAICDVGASTKEHEVGDKRSIGKKGIGFKSVFKVSDVPEVHSNGFHIQFHAKDEQVGRGLGYILPYWIDARTRWKGSVGTTFVLPLNDHSMQRQREISDSLLSFEPSVLLFLQKIRELRLVNEVTGGRLMYQKHEQVISTSHGAEAANMTISVATLQSERVKGGASDETSKTTQRWFIIRRLLMIPSAFAERGEHTEIAIAVPDFDAEDQDAEEMPRPPLQQVFCFLPLRSYGFRFIVQGDFEVPSSREAISNGSDWNQWLISQFPSLVPAFVGLVCAETISLRSLLRVLPLDSDIQAPFRSIVADISREMRQLECFPTAGDTSVLCTASQLLDVSDFADDGAIDFLISDDALVSGALQKRVMDLEVARTMPALLKAQLRVERLRASHVLRLLTFAAPKHDTTLILQLLQLLMKLSRHDRHRSLLLQELRRIKCFPVRVGRSETWTSLAELKSVLFVRSMHAASKTSTLLIDELSVLSDSFTSQLETTFQDTRRFLLDHLGVKELEDHDLAIHHILPAMSKTPTEATEEVRQVWREHVKFLATHVASCGSSCTLRPAIREAIRAITWGGRVLNCHTEENVRVLLPTGAKRFEACAPWLHRRLGSVKSIAQFDVVALDGLLLDIDNDALRALWIGCCKLPELFDPLAKRASQVLGEVVEWIQNESDTRVKRLVSTELARHMDAVWSISISVEDGAAWWQRGAWLEGSDGDFYRPRDLWVASPAVIALFSRSMVPVTKIAFESESLRAAWQLKTTPSVDDVIHVVRAMSETLAAQSGEGESAGVDATQMARLYTYLLDQSRSDEVPTSAAIVRKAFVESSLIFLPAGEDAGVSDRFSGVQGVVWSTGGSAIASVATALDTIYPKSLRAFFVGVCGVERKPTIDQLQQELGAKLADTAAMSKRKWTANVLPLLQMIAKALAKGKMSSTQQKALKKALKGLAWIPVATSDADAKFKLCSMKRSKDRAVVFAEEEAGREILRLCTSLDGAETSDSVADFVVLEDGGVLRDLIPLLRFVGAVSVHENLRMRPAEWCRWLARLGASAVAAEESDSEQQRSRARKKYDKMVKKILIIWSSAWSRDLDASSETPLHSTEFATELSTQSIFPSSRGGQLQRAVDLFLNDQHDLSQAQLQHPSLQTLSLFSWDHFVATDSASDLALRKFLVDVARVRSLAQHLRTEIVLLGPDHPPADASFALAFQRALRVAQRVVFHQYASSYARLDHAKLQQLLSHIQLREVAGDARAVQLVHRVATTEFSLREATSCRLDRASRKVFVAAASDSPTVLFDVLREVCRHSLGDPSIATSVANVLYLASMQPTPESLETWLVHTQNVLPLDARAGTTMWVDDDADDATTVSNTTKRASKRERHGEDGEEAEVEDGEVSDDDDEREVAHKRAKLHASDQQHPCHYDTSTGDAGAWASGPSSYQGGYHQQHHAVDAHHASAGMGPPRPQLPPTAGLASLAFSGSSSTSTNGLSDEEKLAIGRWGEEYVFLQLQQSYAGRPDVVVEWVNQQEESGLPYDIVVKTGASHDVEYVEVKSTKTMEKGVFEISMNELDQAATHGSRYVIYRVFNAGNTQLCRVVRMKNPVALVRQKKISLVLLMQ